MTDRILGCLSLVNCCTPRRKLSMISSLSRFWNLSTLFFSKRKTDASWFKSTNLLRFGVLALLNNIKFRMSFSRAYLKNFNCLEKQYLEFMYNFLGYIGYSGIYEHYIKEKVKYKFKVEQCF